MLDIGFVATFAVFTALGCVSASVASVTQMWSNCLMDAALALVVAAGVAAGDPFVASYAVEAGLPRELAKHEFMQAVLGDISMQWATAFAAMAAVSAVAPLFQCAAGGGCEAAKGSTYDTLNATFNKGAMWALELPGACA